MRTAALVFSMLVAFAARADSVPMSALEKAWTWIGILNSQSATEATGMLREHGVSDAGTKQALRQMQDAMTVENEHGRDDMIALCRGSNDLTDPEALASRLELQEAATEQRRQKIVNGIVNALSKSDQRGFWDSVNSLRGGKDDLNLPAMLRAGRSKPAAVLLRVCEGADQILRQRTPAAEAV